MAKKQAVLLGLRDKLEKDFKSMVADMYAKFKNNQGIFSGHRNTYEAFAGFADDDTKRSFKNVESTVADQLNWFKKYTADYFKTVLSIEKTNAQNVQAELKVDGVSWGKYTTLELLRLKGIIDGQMNAMIHEMPVRSDKYLWHKSEQAEFASRGIWETDITSSNAATTRKDTIIIKDPHIDVAPNRAPMTKEVSERVDIGKETKQLFSGAITELERAEYVVRLNAVRLGIIEALEAANGVDASESDLGDKFLDHLFK